MSGFSERSARVAIRLVKAQLSPPEVRELGETLQDLGEVEREDFMELVRLNDIAPQALLNLRRTSLEHELPEDELVTLERKARQVRARNQRRLAALKELLRDFASAGIEVVILKGVMLAELVWKDHGYKRMNDVDILVRGEDVPRVVEIYRDRRLVPLVLFEGGDPDEVDLAKSHHLPSYVDSTFEFVVGTHWDLVGRKSRIKLDVPRMWRDAEPMDLQGIPVKRLSHLDNLVHLAVHFHHYKTGLRELSDIFNLARHASPLDFDQLGSRLLEAGAASRAYYSLSLAHSLESLGPGEAVAPMLERLGRAADDFSRSEVALRLAHRSLLPRSRSTYESTIEKAFTRFLVETSAHRKLWRAGVLWYRILFPPWWVLERTNVVEKVTLGNLLPNWGANLARTRRVMAETMGNSPWLILVAATVLGPLAALPNYLRRPADDPMARLLEAAGGDAAKIQNLLDYLE